MITASWVPPLVAVRDPRSKPFVMTWSVSGTRSNSHSVAARSSGTNIPLASGEGSGGRDPSLRSAYPSHGLMRFVHLDPPGLIRSREIAGKGAAACSGGLEDGSLDQNASGRILPERDQQLARQSNDHRFAKTAARALDPRAVPQRQR